MGWTKAEFEEFCKKVRVKPEEVLRTGKLDIDASPDQIRQASYKATMQRKAALSKSRKKSYETRLNRGIPLSFPKPDSALALVFKTRTEPEGGEGSPRRHHLKITQYRIAPCDHDNAVGGAKALVDALVLSGLLKKDDWAYLQISVDQVKVTSRTKEHTTISIEYPDVQEEGSNA